MDLEFEVELDVNCDWCKQYKLYRKGILKGVLILDREYDFENFFLMKMGVVLKK